MTPLSNTEWAVARLIPGGLLNKQIAHQLGMAEGTVKVHIKAINKKLGTKNRVQIAVLVDRESSYRPANMNRQQA